MTSVYEGVALKGWPHIYFLQYHLPAINHRIFNDLPFCGWDPAVLGIDIEVLFKPIGGGASTFALSHLHEVPVPIYYTAASFD